MLEPDLFNDGILPDDEELGYDDELEEEELGIDYHEHSQTFSNIDDYPPEHSKAKVLVKRMPKGLAKLFPNVRTMGLELKSGQRVVFINED